MIVAHRAAVAKDGVIPQYHRAGLKKCEAIEATTHTTKTPIATRPTCLDIRSILACKTSASTEALSVVCSLACSKVPDLSTDQRVGSMIYIFAIPQPKAHCAIGRPWNVVACCVSAPRPNSDVKGRVVMREPSRLRLVSYSWKLGRRFKCPTSILISSSAKISKTRAA
jgi:hypothetical protein